MIISDYLWWLLDLSDFKKYSNNDGGNFVIFERWLCRIIDVT